MFNNILTCCKVINLTKREVSREEAIEGSSYNPTPAQENVGD